MAIKRIPYKKIAFTLSAVAMLLWLLLGAGTSLAWFSDTSDKVKNVFNTAEFDLQVEYLDENDAWQDVDATTELFDKEALYEPGYVQVVRLRITNAGTVPFRYQTAVGVVDYMPAVNVYGISFLLQDYLKFGLVRGTETEVEQLVADRDTARENASLPLARYTYEDTLEAGETEYAALIVHMPKDVGNVANYREEQEPYVHMNLIVKASQMD